MPENNDALPFEITVEELKAWREQGLDLALIDVREPHEHSLCRIEGCELLPLGEVPTRFSELDDAKPMVVYCHHGARSARAVQFLRAQGYANAINLGGGIDAWSLRIDPSVPRY